MILFDDLGLVAYSQTQKKCYLDSIYNFWIFTTLRTCVQNSMLLIFQLAPSGTFLAPKGILELVSQSRIRFGIGKIKN